MRAPPQQHPPATHLQGRSAAAHIGALIACCFVASGCATSYLADRIVRAPNRQAVPESIRGMPAFRESLDDGLYSFAAKIRVEPDPADIAVRVIDPGDYKFKYSFDEEADRVGFKTSFEKRDATVAVAPKGTVFLLHGVMMTRESMLHWGLHLAQTGYRVVLVDLRGHGQSTGKVITYGAREPADLSQVLDELTRRNLITGRVGVLGISYGGAIAINWAAREPRIAAVVALAPFCDAQEAIEQFGRALTPKLMSHVSTATLQRALALAAEQGHFTWSETDVLASARQLHQPVLLFHGAKDTWIPPTHSRRIMNAAPAGSRMLMGPGDHLTISMRLDSIAKTVDAWFDSHLSPAVASQAPHPTTAAGALGN